MQPPYRNAPGSFPPDAAPKPENPRRLGRSRIYSPADLPERLTHWHSPRVNRWERLCVSAGALTIERREASGTATERLEAGEARWIAPGVRWRVTKTRTDTRFEFEVHADSRGQADAPQSLRSELLDEAERVTVADPDAFSARVNELAPGKCYLLDARFDADDSIEQVLSDGRLFWHPLDAGPQGLTALVSRVSHPFDLAEYLGRDHAVIEAALAGTLRGDAEYERWLTATLGRHLAMEEALVFPAYEAAGGREAWVRGLKNEHRYLREYLGRLDQADGRRKFLRLLDGHDEKEERVVYPDILAKLGKRGETLLAQVKTFPLPAAA
ncbi:MAG: hemerythrin domain-containing protein [Gammaproteobacteria bacterium]